MKKISAYLFLACEAMLYFSYLAGDIYGIGRPKILKFIAIVLLTVFSLFTVKEKKDRTVIFIFLFTVIADIFFLLLDKPFYGIGVYVIIQLIHSLRLADLSGTGRAAEALKRIIPAVFLGIAGAFVGPVVSLICVYGTFIGINIAHCFINFFRCKNRINLLYLTGMIILLIGDIGVGLRNAGLSFMTEETAAIAYIITWITYLPSLLLILSTTDAFLFKKMSNKD